MVQQQWTRCQSEENQLNDSGKKKKEFRDSSMSLDSVELLLKPSVKYLGVELDSNLPQETRKRLYCLLVQPHVDYCCVVWDCCSKQLQTKVETIQNRGMRYILKSPWSATGTEPRERL